MKAPLTIEFNDWDEADDLRRELERLVSEANPFADLEHVPALIQTLREVT